jgi:hypothetical protein
MIDLTITTTDRKKFTNTDHYDMARLVYKRFGHSPEAAAAAWRRMLQNSATVEDFMGLVNAPTHTPNCEGTCNQLVD